MAKVTRPKDPHWTKPERHGDRYDKMNEGSMPTGRPKGKPSQKKPFKKPGIKTGKVQNG